MRPAALALLLFLATMPSARAADEGVIAYVEGRAVQTAQVRDAAVRFSQRLARIPEARRQSFLIGQIVDTAILSDAARRDGVASPTVESDRDYGRDASAAEAMMNKLAKDVMPSDAEVRTAYDEQVPGIEYRAHHILSPSEDESFAARTRLSAGEKFEDVARSVSTDRGSAPSGGDLGWFDRGKVVKEFGDAVASNPPGTVAGPVKTRFGWHLIRIDDARRQPIPPFEQDAQRIRQMLFERAVGRRIAEMRRSADVRWIVPKPAEW